MTIVEGAPRVAPGAPVPRRGLARRLWNAPVWAHVLLLAVVLVLLTPVVGTHASFSADEGAAIIEAKSLAAGHGWIVPNRLPNVDPTGRYYPLELSARGPAGYAPFAKHPLYAVILAGADRVAGSTGMVLLSVLGTVVAAALGAAIAGRLDPRLRRPAVWARLLSPLLFDGYLVIAHTLGAACVAGAALAVVIAFERRSVLIAAGAAPLLALAVLLRTEAQLLALALAITVLAVAIRRRELWPTAAAAAAASVGGAFFARVVEHAWALHIVGGHVTAAASTSSPQYGLISGRLNAFGITWLLPSYNGSTLLELALIVMLASVILGAFVARRRPEDHAGLMLAAALAVGASVVAFAVDSDNVVPGLLIAFPLGVAGALLIDRAALRSVTAKILTGTFVLFAVAVLATQYPTGGSGEWGGRYFAIGLPLAVPMVLLGLSRAASRLERAVAWRALVALVACSTVMAAMGIVSLRHNHRDTGAFVASLDHVASANPADRPVLISTVGAVPRFAWQKFDRERWLLARPVDLGDLTSRLKTAHLTHALLVTDDPSGATAHIGATVRVTPTDLSRGDWTVLDLRMG